MLAMTWWNRPGLKDFDGILCDGAVRSGKTVSMVIGFFLWSMASFSGGTFAICGKTVGALRRNITSHLEDWLGDLFLMREGYSDHKLVLWDHTGRENTYYLFGGKDESSCKLIKDRNIGSTKNGFYRRTRKTYSIFTLPWMTIRHFPKPSDGGMKTSTQGYSTAVLFWGSGVWRRDLSTNLTGSVM